MDREERLRAHGLPKNFSLTVEISPEIKILQTSDNADIVSNLKELRKVLKDNHVPQVQKWLKVCQLSVQPICSNDDADGQL